LQLGSSFVLLLIVALCTASAARATGPASEGDRALGPAIQSILQRKVLDGAAVGIRIFSLTRQKEVFAHDADEGFIPASNQKLLSIALSLALLGPEYHFETQLSGTGPIDEQGVLQGDLWVEGGGDPTLRSGFLESDTPAAALEAFVQAVRWRGIEEIAGDVVVDASLFDEIGTAPGWPEDQLNRDYCAPVGALSLNGNCLDVLVTVQDGSEPWVRLRPATQRYQPSSRLGVSGKPREMSVWLMQPDEHGAVMVRGRAGMDAGTLQLRVPVRHPDLFFGAALHAALEAQGIEVRGDYRRQQGDDREADLNELYVRRSPLLPALYYCGKESDNNIAEHVLKGCAAKVTGRGSFAAAATVSHAFLERFAASPTDWVVVDGSGLSRLNRVSANIMVELLQYMYESPWRDPFVRSMPISGIDGTLQKRLTEPDMRYRVRAKTGYLRQVSALSGYLMAGESTDPEVFAFAILINGFRGSNVHMKEVQDDLCRLLIGLYP
jgi:PBP4 family serine-type D-alanyl-D-alanine carboxypeptidase